MTADVKIKNIENYAIALSATLVSFTSLRVNSVGIGEVYFIIIFVIGLLYKRPGLILSTRTPFSTLLFLYITVVAFNFYLRYFFWGLDAEKLPGALFDFSAYIVVFFSMNVIESRIVLGQLCVKQLAWRVYAFLCALLIPLHILSHFYRSIFGLPLRTYHLFTPLVENVHQMSMVLCALPFLGLWLFYDNTSSIKRIFILVTAIWVVFMVFDTYTSKGVLGVVAGIIIMMVHKFTVSNLNKLDKIITIIFIVSIILFTILFTYDNLIYYSFNYFSRADTSNERRILYSQALELIANSPLIGYGPGAHTSIFGELTDTHQTFLTAYLQGGLGGFLLFAVFWGGLIRKVFLSSALTGLVIAILVYALGGDIIRRLPVWILLLLAFYLAEFSKKTVYKNTVLV